MSTLHIALPNGKPTLKLKRQPERSIKPKLELKKPKANANDRKASPLNPNQPARSTDIEQFLHLLHDPGDVFELRVPKCPKNNLTWKASSTVAGYFDDASIAAEKAAALDELGASGVYVTLNPCNPALLARAHNRVVGDVKSTANDSDIVLRRWLFIDIDSIRPSGVSATEAEVISAHMLAARISKSLKSEGWPSPQIGMSGNGVYLLYRIELPNDSATNELVKSVLTRLAERFDTRKAKVDPAVSNAARIIKILGTTARKGEDFRAGEKAKWRPHRQSWFVPPKKPLEVVPRQLLETLASSGERPSADSTTERPGTTYRDDMSAADLPDRARAAIAKMPPGVAGEDGLGATFRACCELFRFGLDDADALDLAYEFNQRCEPPWSERELQHKLADAKARVEAAGEFGSRAGASSLARHPTTGLPILSTSHTLPTASLFVEELFTHEGAPTLYFAAGEFRVWKDNHYTAVEENELRQNLYKWLPNFHIPKPGSEDALLPFPANPKTVNDVIATLKASTYLPAETLTGCWLPSEASSDRPPATEILPCKSTLYHLPFGEIFTATPLFFTTYALDYDPDPHAERPERWLEFLGELFGDDQEQVDLLQDWFGYCLTTDTSLQKMLLIVGPPRSGKGTIARILRKLIGENNVCAPKPNSLASEFGLQPLVGKPIAIVSDARFSGSNKNATFEHLLCISGEDAVTVNRKFLEAITMKLPTRFMFLSNELPACADSSSALAKRFLILHLRKSYFGKENARLTEELAAELPGILNWAIAGWRRLQARRAFMMPKSSEEAVQLLEDLTSRVGAFVRERCLVQDSARVDCADLYSAWCEWCEENGHNHPGTKQSFGKELGAYLPSVRTRTGSTERFYDGISLKATFREATFDDFGDDGLLPLPAIEGQIDRN